MYIQDYYQRAEKSEQRLLNISREELEEDNLPNRRMISFWEGYRAWISAAGISLYELRIVSENLTSERWYPPPVAVSGHFPFATRLDVGSTAQRGRGVRSKFGFGQDLAGHDVCIKLTAKGSAEHQINQYLLENSRPTEETPFPYVLPPVLVLDSPYHFSFVVMPLWGTAFQVESFDSVGLMLTFIRCLLTGLSYLHEHRIAHRDIRETNVLVNGYCPGLEEYESSVILKKHTSEPDAAFCFFDYDHAIQLPHNVSLKNARRPAWEGNQGSLEYHPRDISLAEPEYNPFAFDVACLGNMFLHHFTDAIPIVPPLAPLFAGMTTHVVEKRFTAVEALSFFNDHLSRLPDDVLAHSVALSTSFEPLCDPDMYWSLLDPQGRQRWKEYQVPPRTWSQRVLGWIAGTDWGWKFLRAVRLMFHI